MTHLQRKQKSRIPAYETAQESGRVESERMKECRENHTGRFPTPV